MKQKRMLFITAAVVIAIAAGASLAAGADSYEPGSSEDPVVTKSYVDNKISELSAGGAAFMPIELKEGQTIIGSEGTEVILRSGEAAAIGNGENGVSDLTAGTDLTTGQAVAANHLLLIPRADGRGITATTDTWVMIRGGYTIQ